MKTIDEFFKGDRYAVEQTGVELLEARLGYAKARMEIKPALLNGGGVCQGGAIFTLADFASAVAANSHGTLTLSISAEVHFFNAESTGFLYAEAQEIYDKGHLSHCDVKVTNGEDVLVATFHSTGYHKKQKLPFASLQ